MSMLPVFLTKELERESQKVDDNSKKNRVLYESHLKYLRHTLITLLPCLTFFQKPLWCKSDAYSV
jgi:hypothetical protein